MDIMQEQNTIGHEVSLLWPGEMKLFNKFVSIVYRGNNHGIGSWEILNPLPVSYDEGITNIDAFTASCSRAIYENMLQKIMPNVIHIHTFMGLHKEFIEAAKRLGIRTVFSVHDFFPICPKVTMFREGDTCRTVKDCVKCPKCNLTALSLWKIMILQSPMYRALKDSSILKKLRKRHRDQYLSGKAEEKENKKNLSTTQDDYKKLRGYYYQMLSQIDMVHYNSTVTKKVFEEFFRPENKEVISISHANIKDNRRIKSFDKQLRLTYLGPQGEAKGFFVSGRHLMNCG